MIQPFHTALIFCSGAILMLIVITAACLLACRIDSAEEDMAQERFERGTQQSLQPMARAEKALGEDKWLRRFEHLEDSE